MAGRVLLAVGGGAAAIKAPLIVRRLAEAGYRVRVLATERALAFTTELALATVSGRPVATETGWFAPSGRVLHLELAEWADLVLVAPATAADLARAAAGLAEDLLTAVLTAGPPRVVWAPAMNPRMWADPAVQANVGRLKARGHAFAGPASGAMAGVGEAPGPGRMLEPEELVEHVRYHLTDKDYAGRRVLVTAGPTREHLDPVRFLSNPSSGKMGYAVARAARDRGARVVLVSGPTALADPFGVEVVRVESAEAMREAVLARYPAAEVVVMAAAVADWRPAERRDEKEAKLGEEKHLRLVRTPDILAELGARKGDRVLVGFAMETHAGPERAFEKLRRKHLDLICLNYPTDPETAFGAEENRLLLIDPSGRTEALGRAPKRVLADRLLDRVRRIMQ